MNATKPSAYGPQPGPPVNPVRPPRGTCELCGIMLHHEWVGRAPLSDGYLCGPCHRADVARQTATAEAESARDYLLAAVEAAGARDDLLSAAENTLTLIRRLLNGEKPLQTDAEGLLQRLQILEGELQAWAGSGMERTVSWAERRLVTVRAAIAKSESLQAEVTDG